MRNTKTPLGGRHFISLDDFTAEELFMFWDLAAELKQKQRTGEPHRLLEGKALAMIFEIPSTRTRTSFEVGIQQLGGHGLFFSRGDYWSEMEEIRDQGKVFSRYVDGIVLRACDQEEVVEMAKWADSPVINACTNYEHPCQVMADFMTTREKKKKLEGLKTVIIWTTHTKNIPLGIVNSTLFAGSKVGMDVTIACPEAYDPDPEVLDATREEAKLTGARIEIMRDMKEAVNEADVIHIKSWSPHEIFKTSGIDVKASLEPPHIKNREKYEHWKVTQDIVDLAKKDVIVQHALPVVRNIQASNEVLDGPHSVIFDEAENRLHTQKAIMALIMR